MKKNHLVQETSLYLQQHAENPVDWYPYGNEAFAKAQAEQKPIFLSIGYSACHWCHVMAHESFEDEETANIVNKHFLSIKVDREEYPEVDSLYQRAYQTMSGQAGGWPLSMFLTPEGIPFYGGTYFPKEERYGLPAFAQVLHAVAKIFQKEPEKVVDYGARVMDRVAPRLGTSLNDQRDSLQGAGGGSSKDGFLSRAPKLILQNMDRTYGGLQGAPKFPNVPVAQFLLSASFFHKEPAYADAVLLTLEQMAKGGIYDHLGGGFCRYSTDEVWHIPHFEKMLYDNALLLKLYSEGFLVASAMGKHGLATQFESRVSTTIGWLLEEMRHPQGGYFASVDADSEGVEGKYYVWTRNEIKALCTNEETEVFCRCYDVTEQGNWPHAASFGLAGANVLREIDHPKDEREMLLLKSAKQKLLGARKKRVPPATDRKILTSWNGLLLSGLATAAKAFQSSHYFKLAEQLAEYFFEKSKQGLLRNYQDGAKNVPATLDDYIFLSEGYYHLAAGRGDRVYLEHSQALLDETIDKFYHPEFRQFVMVSEKEKTLPFSIPLIQEHDGALPAGTGIACLQLLRFAELLATGGQGEAYRKRAEALLAQSKRYLQNPLGYPTFCHGLSLQRGGLTLVGIAPGVKKQDVEDFIQISATLYVPEIFWFVFDRPNVAESVSNGVREKSPFFLPMLEEKSSLSGETTAYVCQGHRCLPPVTNPSELRRILSSLSS